MNAINGKEISAKIIEQICTEIKTHDYKIKLAIILIGEDPASALYVKYKIKRASEANIETQLYKFENNATEKEIADLIETLNSDKNITGFFIQAPIPNHIDINNLTSMISPTKDVDGMSPLSLGNLFHKNKALIAATPLAVIEAIKSIKNFKLEGKDTLIINRSPIIGKPLAALLLNENATVQMCHTKSKNIFEKTKLADVIILGTGKINFLSSKDISADAIIIDCGAPNPEFKIEENTEFNGTITPVPGGIGPITIACLLKNCLISYKLQNNIN